MASDPQNFNVEEWNYLWSGAYGSDDYSVKEPRKKGRDVLAVQSAQLSPDGKTLTLAIADWRSAMQVHVKFKGKTAEGREVDEELYSTVHQLP